jgi:hypothetical protein
MISIRREISREGVMISGPGEEGEEALAKIFRG